MLRKYFGNDLHIQLVYAAFQGLRKIVTHIADGAAQRAQHAGAFRDQHGADADFADDGRTVHRPRAAKSNESEITRIVAALDGQKARAARHVLVDHGQNSFGGFFDAQAHLFAKRLNRFARAFEIQRRAAFQTNWIIRIDAAQHNVGVGDGGFCTAVAVTHGPRHRARAARSDLQNATAIHVSDAATARADGMHVDHRQAQRNAEIEVGGFGNFGHTIDHHSDVVAGAAHVAGDDAVETRFGGEARGGNHTRRGT